MPFVDERQGHNVTVRFHHGGKLITKPSAEYVGGIVSVYDYVPVRSLCIDILNEMCEGLGYFDSKKFYRLDKSRGKFYEVCFLTDIQMMCGGYITKGRELTFYLDAQLSLFDSDTEVTPNEPIIESHPHNEPNYKTIDDYVDKYVSGNRDKGTDEDDDNDSETTDEFHESDYEMNDEDYGVEENPQRVDATKGGEVPGCNESSSDDYSEEDMVYSGDDFDSGVESNEEEIERFPTFDPSDKYKPTFEIGMKIYAKCLGKGCDWRINVLKVKGENTFQELRISNPGSTVILVMENGVDEDAYAIVSSETRQNWEWFLTLLKEDLNMVRDDAYTFISDKQKGLIPAFQNVLPGVDNRYCVRHSSGNMKTSGGFKCLAYKHALWNAALATTIPYFESFNSSILETREKPVITMLEWIREYLMTRLTGNRDRATRRWGNKKVCPNIRKIIDKNMERARDCIAIKSNAWNYEVSCFYDSSKYIVNLSGIPCKHGMSAICDQALYPEDFVHEYYNVNSYNRVYQHAILPVNGQRLWPKTGYIPPLPLNFGRKVGRPYSARRMEPDESRSKGKKQRGKKPVTLGKQKYKVKCHYCGEQGHNQKGCGKKREDTRTISEVSEAVPPQPQVQPTSSDTSPISTPIVMMPTPGHNFLPQSTQHRVNIRAPAPFAPGHPILSQCSSNVSTASSGGVPVLLKGGKKFVTMTILSQVVAAVGKKKGSKDAMTDKKKKT
ncbi:hypothetical protein BUALT_Bualt03G0222300 [Buddleja alternifolia]|uniref:CCHC-type domain-containing protein n=1 Tax=Buddleja alternifolia TaxID=168488 RepID=A0AAV6Y077_9LAMI|nr:hypothetical protein BUALT_Bualt03G0222300 [Buddleja alternifolia]